MIIERRMTKNPVTASPDMKISDAAELMKKEKVHRLPVLDKNGKLIGVVSEKDILKAAPSPVSTLSAYETNYLLSKLTIKKIMSSNPVTISKDTTVEEAARLMVDEDISCLPVLENEKLVGIVSKTDMFKMLLELFGARHFGVRIEFLVEDKPGTIATISHALAERGMDIISLGTFMGTDASNAICTVKVQGGSVSQVVDIMKPYVMQILDVREV